MRAKSWAANSSCSAPSPIFRPTGPERAGYFRARRREQDESRGHSQRPLVNTTTAEIIYTGTERGEASFSNVFVAGMGGGVDWDESQARQIFEPAVQRAVTKIVSSVANIKDSPRLGL